MACRLVGTAPRAVRVFVAALDRIRVLAGGETRRVEAEARRQDDDSNRAPRDSPPGQVSRSRASAKHAGIGHAETIAYA